MFSHFLIVSVAFILYICDMKVYSGTRLSSFARNGKYCSV